MFTGSSGRAAVVVDGGVHQRADLCGLRLRTHARPPVVLDGSTSPRQPTDVLGCLSLPDDVLAESASLPPLSVGDVLAFGNSGTGKTHLALALGLAACQKGYRVRFTTAAALVHGLMEAKDEKRLLRFQKLLASYELLIIDELGFVPLSKTGAQMLFEIFSLRYERGATMVTSNLPCNEWTEVLGSERLTGALLDRLTHHVHILEMNGESCRLKESKRKRPAKPASRSSTHP